MPADPPLRALRVHLGAHKTATTHLQKALHRHRAALAAADIDFVRPIELRAALHEGEHRLSRLPWRARARLVAALSGLRSGAGTLCVSEENLLGQIRDLFDATPYRNLAARIAPLRHLAAGAPVSLFLAVRPFDRLWPSAHAEALRHHPHDPDRIARLRRIARSAPPSWLDVVDRVAAACPRATIRVWRYEDHEAHWPEIAAALLGADTGPIAAVRRPNGTMSPSAEGVRLAEAAAGPDRRAEVRAIYAAHPATSGAPYAPFDAVETAALRDRHAADLAALAARGQLLAFDEPSSIDRRGPAA